MTKAAKEDAKNSAAIRGRGDKSHEFMAYAYYAHELNFMTKNGILVHPIEWPSGKVTIALVINQDTTIR